MGSFEDFIDLFTHSEDFLELLDLFQWSSDGFFENLLEFIKWGVKCYGKDIKIKPAKAISGDCLILYRLLIKFKVLKGFCF